MKLGYVGAGNEDPTAGVGRALRAPGRWQRCHCSRFPDGSRRWDIDGREAVAGALSQAFERMEQ